MAVHTEKSLQRLFEASRLRNEKRRQQEQLKYEKAQEAVKKALAKQQSINAKKLAEKAQKQQTEAISRTIYIYNTKYIERFADENELYQTREELEDAMPNNINWTLWDKLIEETKQMLTNDQGREKRIR